MTEDIFTGILESYRKEEISIEKAKRSIRLLLDVNETSDTKKEQPFMGQRRIQKIYVCNMCGEIPEDGDCRN
jgi:hypothetical protein